MGTRDKAAGLDFSGILEEEMESQLKEAAQISMGTEISIEDLDNIMALCDQVKAEWVVFWGTMLFCRMGVSPLSSLSLLVKDLPGKGA